MIVTLMIATLLTVSAGFGFSATAPSSSWVRIHETSVRLVSATRAVGSAQTVTLGLHFRLKPGWRIYWQTVGDTFLAPRIDLQDSENIASVELSWPLPKRVRIFGHLALAYQDEVVLPLQVTVAEPGHPLFIRASVAYLACNNICVPSEAGLSLDLPDGPLLASDFADLIAQYAEKVPPAGPAQGLSVEEATVINGTNRQILYVAARSETPFQQPELLVGGPVVFEFSAPEVALSEQGRRATFVLDAKGLNDQSPSGQTLKLILVDGERAAEQILTVGTENSEPTVAEPGEQSPSPGLFSTSCLCD